MRVYVHANCQGPPIAEMIRACFPHWEVASYEVFGEKILSEIGRYRYLVDSADVIISQPIHAGYRDRDDLSLDWVRATAKPSCEVLVFPSIHFEGQLVGWRTLPFPGYGMPYHDSLLVALAASGLPAGAIVDLALSPRLFPYQFITDEIEISIREAERREREDDIDVVISPFLRDYGEMSPLFHIINHPIRPVLAHMTASIMAALGYRVKIPAGGSPCIPLPHVPCHPSVLRMFDQAGVAPADWSPLDREFYHIPGRKLTRMEYTQQSLAAFLEIGETGLLSGLRNAHVLPFLRRVRDGVPMVGEILANGPLGPDMYRCDT